MKEDNRTEKFAQVYKYSKRPKSERSDFGALKVVRLLNRLDFERSVLYLIEKNATERSDFGALYIKHRNLSVLMNQTKFSSVCQTERSVFGMLLYTNFKGNKRLRFHPLGMAMSSSIFF